jgi:carbamoyltransferase
MLILGLNYGDHDPSAALVEDGRPLILVEHERVCRTKRAKFLAPTSSIIECLRSVGAEAADVDLIAVGWSEAAMATMALTNRRFRLVNVLPGEFGELGKLPPVVPVRHHLAHAASAFWCSDFSDAAVLVVDGEGEDDSISIWHGTHGGLTEIERFPPQMSLGHYYKAATKFSGLEADGGNHEGKLMGLSSYGRPTERMPLTFGAGGFEFDQSVAAPDGPRLRERFRDSLHAFWRMHSYPYDQGDGREIMAYANFAASVQQSLEAALIQLAERAKRVTGCDNLALAGGVGQNCAANGALAARKLYERIYIQPACHDAGVSLGAALQAWHQATERVEGKASVMSHAAYGLCQTADDCARALDSSGLSYERLDEPDLLKQVAQWIADGKVVGWFSGPAEVGPRALGARSILADPRKRSNLVKVNNVKQREVWRPFAPSVLEEYFDEFFECPIQSPFMNVACPVRPAVRHQIPAVVHVDGTARPQAVSRQHLPRYWELIEQFRQLTGIPVLLNTSFNLRGEPIVSTPRDAIRDFVSSPLDILILENCVVKKH